MKNYIKPFVFLFYCFFVFLISGCNTKINENYSLQGVFTSDLVPMALVFAEADKLKIELPISDFSCDVNSFTTSLGRKHNTFIVTLSGNETKERCPRNFTGIISGIKKGEYQLEVIYKKDSQSNELLFKKFIMD